ncbi:MULTISPECIES: hypothetical protein [Streptomyces]|uniref:Uncharacterized protein n=1 Tax=Streptomyces changanensis TaxID=2964669 RepID=A0ABY5N5U9_9ACTN|nr:MULTISPECIES: hypothetical protein [Streptomyces]UUS31581.1 hypothetical protein NRO40_12575 [Streptomyces changanensis]
MSGISLRVYRVGPDGTTTTVLDRRAYEPDDRPPPLDGLAYPPCSCARCAEGRTGQ